MLDNIFTIILIILLCGIFGWFIYAQVRDYYKSQHPKLYEIKEMLKNAYYDGNKLFEDDFLDAIQMYHDDKSYTINKQKIYLCLNDENGELYNDNVLIHVVLHEIAHVLCNSIGHTEEFVEIFDDLLEKANKSVTIINGEKKRLYNFSIPIPENYCQY